MSAPLLAVSDLHVAFPGDGRPIRAVNGTTFTVRAGERVGLVGESGSGKTVTALSVMGLVRSPPATLAGEIRFEGKDLLALRSDERRRLRGDRIAMVFQNPLNSLNPAMTVGEQIVEAILAHRRMSRREARGRAVELLDRVGIPSPARSVDEHPHRFSGGMRQRSMIAMALSCQPNLLLADEPTTALDVRVQDQIVDLLASLSEERGMAVALITHDLALLAGFAERVVVMYSGRVMEDGAVDQIYYGASHPYTWGLMRSTPRLDEPDGGRLTPIVGAPPSAVELPAGCPFHPRCPCSEAVCRQEVPPLVERAQDDHRSACHFAGELRPPAELRERPRG